MADTDTETLQNGTSQLNEEEEERLKQRPADIDADVREMERRKRVEALMSSKLFREELERVLDQQMHEGNDAPLLQRIREMVGGRLHSGSLRGPTCVLPINDIRGIEGIGYEKGEKILRCKLAAVYRLVDLFGWTQTGVHGQITARLNTAVEQVLTTPRGLLPHEVTASSLVKVDMQGVVQDQGTTNFPVNVEGFSVHAAVHAARPDLKCVVHVRAASALAVSAARSALLPLSQEAAALGDAPVHTVPHGILDNEERDKLVRALGPHAKVLILTNSGALCCGSTLEEAFHHARLFIAAADVQLKLASIPRDELIFLDPETRRQIYEAAHKPPQDQAKWRVGGEEFEALMRMLDNAGFRTGYIYRHPLIKNDVPRPKNDVEVPPAVSSLGYLLEEEELYKQGLWKKGQGKTGERTRWLNSPNVYQKVEVLETGTNDPKKITKWVDANNDEWVQDGSPAHSSTPVKIDTLQFVPKNTNPKEFKKLQQQIKDNRRADKISAGPQSHILEGVTWDEASKLVGEDAVNTHTGDHVVLMGAASKGIIQRGYQHNATVYSAPYARNPFDHVTDTELADYTRAVHRKQNEYDTDLSESEAISGVQITSPASAVSETEEESRDEHRVLRIETTQAPVRSQPEVVLSDVDTTDFLNMERAHADRTKDTNRVTSMSDDDVFVPTKPPRAHRAVRDPNLLSDDEVFLDSAVSDMTSSVTSGITSPPPKPIIVRVHHKTTNVVYNRGTNVTNEAHITVNKPRTKYSYTRNSKFDDYLKLYGSPEANKRRKHNTSETYNREESPYKLNLKPNRLLGVTRQKVDSSDSNNDNNTYNSHKANYNSNNSHIAVDNNPKYNHDFIRKNNDDSLKTDDFAISIDIMNYKSSNDNLTHVSERKNTKTYINRNLTNILNTNANNRNTEKTDPYSQSDKTHPKCKLSLQYHGNEKELLGSKSSLSSIPSIEWDYRYRYDCKSKSLPRIKSRTLFRTRSHSGFINSYIRDPSPTHFHYPTWRSNPHDLKRYSKSLEQLHSLDEAEIVKVKEVVLPKFKVTTNPATEFVESQEFNEDNYLDDVGECFTSQNDTVIPVEVVNDKAPTDDVYRAECVHIDDDVTDQAEGEYHSFTEDFDEAYESPVKDLVQKDIRDYSVPINFYCDDYKKVEVKKSPLKCRDVTLEPILEESKSSYDDSNNSNDRKDFILHVSSEKTTEVCLDNSNDMINKEEGHSQTVNELIEKGTEPTDASINIETKPSNYITANLAETTCKNDSTTLGYKVSIESEVSTTFASFNSTAEFEKLEIIAELIANILNKIDYEGESKVNLDTFTKNVLQFKNNDLTHNIEAPTINYSEEVINEELSNLDSEDSKDNDKDQSTSETFSMTKLVENIELNLISNDTILTESDVGSDAYKIVEGIIYYVFNHAFYSTASKRNKANKKVVTVVDIEDILFTAMCLWREESLATDDGHQIGKEKFQTDEVILHIDDKQIESGDDKINLKDKSINITKEKPLNEFQFHDFDCNNQEENIDTSIIDRKNFNDIGKSDYPYHLEDFDCNNESQVNDVTDNKVEDNIGKAIIEGKVNESEGSQKQEPKNQLIDEIEKALCDLFGVEDIGGDSIVDYQEYTNDIDLNDENRVKYHLDRDDSLLEIGTEVANDIIYERTSENDVSKFFRDYSNNDSNFESICNKNNSTFNINVTSNQDSEIIFKLDSIEIDNASSDTYNVNDNSNNTNDDSTYKNDSSNLGGSDNNILYKSDTLSNEDSIYKNDMCSNSAVLNDTEGNATYKNDTFESNNLTDDNIINKNSTELNENITNDSFINEFNSNDISNNDTVSNTSDINDNDMNTAFLHTTVNHSTPPRSSKAFDTCTESPIKKNSTFKNSYSIFCDNEIISSPFLKKPKVMAMSQTENTGGIKYWVSFDETSPEDSQTTTYRSARNLDETIPSFYSLDLKENQRSDLEKAQKNAQKSVLIAHNDYEKSPNESDETFVYENAHDLTYNEYDHESTSPPKKLLYNAQKRRLYSTWPPFEQTVFYKLISKFRMSESFDEEELLRAKIIDS